MTRAIVAIVVAVGVAVGAVVLVGSGDSDEDRVQTATSSTLSRRDQAEADEARAWSRQVIAAFTPLVDSTPELIKGAREWVEGNRPTEQFQQEVDAAIGRFLRSRDDLAAVEPYRKAPHALALFQRGGLLYLEFARIYRAAVLTPPGELRTQLDVLARRVRELGDRVYDRGTAAMAPYVHDDPLKDVDVRLPEEVPMWTAEGMAPGPPLDDPPAPADPSPPVRAKSRPQQSLTAWRRAVATTPIPSTRELAAAIDSGDSEVLRALARRFVDAAEALRPVPDPRDQREKSTITRLSLLVWADAGRSAQAAAFVDAEAAERLRASSKRLALVAERLWPAELGSRPSGFDSGLLAQDG